MHISPAKSAPYETEPGCGGGGNVVVVRWLRTGQNGGQLGQSLQRAPSGCRLEHPRAGPWRRQRRHCRAVARSAAVHAGVRTAQRGCGRIWQHVVRERRPVNLPGAGSQAADEGGQKSFALVVCALAPVPRARRHGRQVHRGRQRGCCRWPRVAPRAPVRPRTGWPFSREPPIILRCQRGNVRLISCRKRARCCLRFPWWVLFLIQDFI